MLENAMELGAEKVTLEEINSKLANGLVNSELVLLAKGLGIRKDVIIAILIDAVQHELAIANSQITFNAAVSH